MADCVEEFGGPPTRARFLGTSHADFLNTIGTNQTSSDGFSMVADGESERRPERQFRSLLT